MYTLCALSPFPKLSPRMPSFPSSPPPLLPLRCLQDKKVEKDFGKGCKAEVVKYEAEISQDYRLNTRLAKACTLDIEIKCSGLCSVSDGAVRGGRG